MKKKRLKIKVKVFLALILAVIVAADVVLISEIKRKDVEDSKAVSTASNVVVSSSESDSSVSLYTDDEVQTLRDTLAKDQDINHDVVAYLSFQNHLIEQPVLLGSYTDEYLYKNWETGEASTWGSIVLDTRNMLSSKDMNTIIYGHYVYTTRTSDRTLVFTPLSQLIEKSAYEDNKYLSLTMPDEIRYYEIASVYDCAMEDVEGGQAPAEDMQFNLLEYDQDYFETYMKAVKENEYYDTGVEITYGDKLLSLSTCIEDHPESREIVLCKEIGREKFAS